MTMTPYLGPRAAMLLGLLVTTPPKTVNELLDMVSDGLDLLGSGAVEVLEWNDALAGVSEWTPKLTLESLADGGPAEIRKQLTRLEKHGFVRRAVFGPNTPHLWWAA